MTNFMLIGTQIDTRIEPRIDTRMTGTDSQGKIFPDIPKIF